MRGSNQKWTGSGKRHPNESVFSLEGRLPSPLFLNNTGLLLTQRRVQNVCCVTKAIVHDGFAIVAVR